MRSGSSQFRMLRLHSRTDVDIPLHVYKAHIAIYTNKYVHVSNLY